MSGRPFQTGCLNFCDGANDGLLYLIDQTKGFVPRSLCRPSLPRAILPHRACPLSRLGRGESIAEMYSKLGIFAPFEWMIALRYLRPRRREAFISVISLISLVGIALGVAALIIVMAVMNGFRHDLLARILGFNGHIVVAGPGGDLTISTRSRHASGW